MLHATQKKLLLICQLKKLSQDAKNTLMNLTALVLIKQNAPINNAQLKLTNHGQHARYAKPIQKTHYAGYQLIQHQNAIGIKRDVLTQSANLMLSQRQLQLQLKVLMSQILLLITGLLHAIKQLCKILNQLLLPTMPPGIQSINLTIIKKLMLKQLPLVLTKLQQQTAKLH